MKICCKCANEKSNSAFYRRNASPDGRSPKCRSCTAEDRPVYVPRVKRKGVGSNEPFGDSSMLLKPLL